MGEDERDDGWAPGGARGTPTRCAICGAHLDPGTWHPTVGHTEPGGMYRIVRFCSDECHDAWTPEREERAGH